jgi:VanZ family protein
VLRKLLLPAAVIYTLALVVVTFINLNGVPSLGSSFDDKIYHFIAYAGLAGLWITYSKSTQKEHKLWVVFVIIILFGVLLEVLQHQLNENRTYDTYDLLANCFGVIIGTLIAARVDIIKLK